jgi:hypothetical protein
MANTDNFYAVQARNAEKNITGEQFCFSCQKHRKIENMKDLGKGRWRCTHCLEKRKENQC